MRVIFDIEASGLLDIYSIDYSQFPYKLKPTFKLHCICALDIDTGTKYQFYEDTLSEFKTFAKQITTIIGHNIIDYDLRVLQLYFNIPYHITQAGEWFDGRRVKIIDTLVLSKLLNPDRPAHGLAWWGKKLGFEKGDIKTDEDGEDIPDVWETFTIDMLEYCQNDVELTFRLYQHLIEEMGDWDWKESYKLEKQVKYIISKYQHYGFAFDWELAERNVEELDRFIKEIVERVEPRLPNCKMNKGEQKPFIPPKIQFKKDGSISSHLNRFIEKHNGKLLSDDKIEFYGKTFNLPLPLEPIINEKKMTLKDQTEIKQWLISLGWSPSTWKDRDITCKSGTKIKATREDMLVSYYKWRDKIVGTPYEAAILEEMEHSSIAELDDIIEKLDIKRPFKILTNPSYVKNQEKEICDDLLRLGEKVDFVKDIVNYLTYKHRRSSISGGDEDKGWLNNERLFIDGRISTPADTIGTNTSRFRHIDVCNIPRVSSLYGENIRAMFGVEDHQYELGYDGSGLEARIQGHHIFNYEGGQEFAKLLLQDKPNSIHCVTARNLGIPRDIAKNIRYALMYGAQWKKIKKMLGWSDSKSKQLFNDFWDDSLPLKLLKEDLEKYWTNVANKKFVKGIDGRKIPSRSKHSLINALFQSNGVVVMKRAMVMHFDWLEQEDLIGDPFVDNIFEKECGMQMIHYHDEAQWALSKSLVKFKKFNTKEEALAFNDGKVWSSEIEKNDKFYRAYSRIGELAVIAVREAGKFYKLNVDLDSSYIVGTQWASCH